MNGDPDPAGAAPPGGGGEAQPTEEEMRARIEEQIRKVRVQDLLLENVASILNLSARRIAKEDERDLEQARIGIDAVRALVGLLEPEPAKQVQTALSEVQVMYAREAGGESRPAAGEGEGDQPEAKLEPEPPPAGGQQRGPSRLWTPPGT